MIVRVTPGIFALLALLLASCVQLQAADIASLQNEFVKVVVNTGPNEIGRFSIDSTGGDPSLPSSKNQQLIYGGAAPWTSYTTVRIDDTDYVFGSPTKRRAGRAAKYGVVVIAPAVTDNIISTTCRFDDIDVTQELSIVRGHSSRMLDAVGIAYRISNKGATAHQVGLRILLDTKLGANDGAPMRAGAHEISSPTMLSGKDIPDYWQAFDDLQKPTVVSQGFFRNEGLTMPDAVIFADWGTMADTIWMPKLNPAQGFHRKWEGEDTTPADGQELDELDSAAALYWNPDTLAAGKTISYNTEYGLGYVKSSTGQLTLGITGPSDTTFEYERTQPITITGYLKNTGTFDGKNVTLTLKLPEGLVLVGGSKATLTSELLKQGEEMQGSWRIAPTGKVSGPVSVTLEGASDNLETNVVKQDVAIAVPTPSLLVTPVKQSVQPKTNRYATKVPITIRLKPAVDFYGVSFTLDYDAALLQPLMISRGACMVDDGRLLDGWEYDDATDGKITFKAVRGDAGRLLTQAETTVTTVTFYVVGEGTCQLTLEKAKLLNEKGEEVLLQTVAGAVTVKAETPR